MKELNEEIKETINMMQADIDDGSHGELRFHLVCLLKIKRERLVTETGLQAELERERERRFEGNRIASAEHRDEVECLVSDLRDHFAGLAMQAYIHTDPIMMHDDEDIAKMAYAAADAMIKER